jgi:hypothetical protein
MAGHARPAGRLRTGHDEYTIVALLLAVRRLNDLEDADRSALQHEARISGGIMNDEDIERIAVLGLGRWDETPIVGIGQSHQQRFGQRECPELRIEFELGAATTRRFDHRVDVALIGPGRQFGVIRHIAMPQPAVSPSKRNVAKSCSVRRGDRMGPRTLARWPRIGRMQRNPSLQVEGQERGPWSLWFSDARVAAPIVFAA